MSEARKYFWPWLGLLGLVVLAGLYTAFKLFTEGHGLFNANDVLMWTLPLGSYVFLALTSSGLTLLASIPLVFGLPKFEPAAKRLVFLSLATLMGAFVSIGLELGSVFHMIYILFSPNLSSPIWWMGAIYSLELVLLVLEFWRMHQGDAAGSLARFLGTVSFLCALVAPLMIGSVFGLTESRVTYFGPVMSIYCLLMALMSGSAFFILYSQVLAKVTKERRSPEHEGIIESFTRIFLFVLGLFTLFTLLKFAIESATTIPDFYFFPEDGGEFRSWNIFSVEILLGLFLPFVLMLVRPIRYSHGGRLLAGALVWVGALGIHMQILLAGQSRPIGPKAEQYSAVISYFPSVWEWLVLALALSIMLALYTLGERYLKLGPSLA
ncbi:MAG: NrfD/PsrC family molybdoenzyme membrane anchor subunit [Thermodesulfobacteriota bacterium]